MDMEGMTRTLRAAALVAAALGAAGAQAQGYPDRPIRMVVGFSAGGSVDGSARIAAQLLSEGLGKPVVVENLLGASGGIAAATVAKAEPDGYTLFVSAPANVINPIISKQTTYSLVSGFAAVGLIADVPNVLVVHPAVPADTVAGLVAYGKANPGVLSYASAGVGSVSHLAGALFGARGGMEMVHVPYKGTSAAQIDLLSGRVPVMFDSMVTALSSAKAGKLKALAVSSAQRSPTAPELPTLAESGFPGFSVTTWIGLHAPVGTPQPVIARLSAVLLKGLQTREAGASLAALGAEPGRYSPEEFSRFLSAEAEHWRSDIERGVVRVE
jgi:tripartite-type tricarboxylate transporter receptor subunit TctC